MSVSSLTGLDAAWVDEKTDTLVLVNGEDKHETRAALDASGCPTTHLGTYRGFFWYRLDERTLVCICGVGPSNVELAVTDADDAGIGRVVRLGTCGSLASDLAVGDAVIANEGVAFHDGVASVGAHAHEVRTRADPGVLDELVAALKASEAPGRTGVVMGTPFFHDPPETTPGDRYRELCSSGDVDALDMETGTLFWLGADRGLATGSVVGVANAVGETHLDGPAGLSAAARVIGAWCSRRDRA